MNTPIAPTPLISVIVPTYNAAPFLETCLDTLTEQTLRHIEIIPVNDGSSDRSGIIMNIFSAKDDRIKPIQRKQSGGFARMVNNGIAAARGNYIAIVPPCYTPAPNMLEVLYEHAASACADGADVTHASLNCTFPPESQALLHPYEDIPAGVFSPAHHPSALLGAPLLCPALFKRDFLLERNISMLAAVDNNLRDMPFFLMTLMHADIACHINTPLAGYNADAYIPYVEPDEAETTLEIFGRIEESAFSLRSKRLGLRYALDAIKCAYLRAAYHAHDTSNRSFFLHTIRQSLRGLTYKSFSENPYISRADKDFIFQAAYAPPLRFILGYGLRTKLRERALPLHENA